MNRLIKPRKQSYAGEDAQILAYSRISEMAWAASLCVGAIGAAGLLGIAVPPLLAAVGVSCFVHYVLFSAASRGYI